MRCRALELTTIIIIITIITIIIIVVIINLLEPPEDGSVARCTATSGGMK